MRRISRVTPCLVAALSITATGLGAIAPSRALATTVFATPGSVELTVPAGATGADVVAIGAAGGSGCAAGGKGALVSTSIAVTPGEKLYGNVGGVGEAGATVKGELECPGGAGSGKGGVGGGGSVAEATSGTGGGSGGGGASWLATASGFNAASMLVVAGGGGGGGFPSGARGGSAGAVGEAGTKTGEYGGAGGGGGQAGGAGAGGGGAAGAACRSANSGGSGAAGQGGGGGEGFPVARVAPELGAASGGGGGGGWYGGGGGGGGAEIEAGIGETESCRYSGGGGGGSSFVALGALSAEPTSETARVAITYTFAPPTVVIGAPAEGAAYAQGQVVTASYTCADGEGAPGIESCAGPVASGAAVDTSTPGVHAFAVTATSKDGEKTTATHTYSVSATPIASTTTTTTTTSTNASSTAPRISDLRQSHARWREGSRLPRISAAKRRLAPMGTAFSFSLNGPASVTLRFMRKVAGRRVRGRCVAKTRRGTLRRPCARTITAGELSFTGHLGANRVVFEGRISHAKRLLPGRYVLVVEARNAAGHGRPARLAFTIVR